MKTPQTRLLDLLAGWERFLENEEGGYPVQSEPKVTNAVFDLYQEVGRQETMTDAGLRYALARVAMLVVNGGGE